MLPPPWALWSGRVLACHWLRVPLWAVPEALGLERGPDCAAALAGEGGVSCSEGHGRSPAHTHGPFWEGGGSRHLLRDPWAGGGGGRPGQVVAPACAAGVGGGEESSCLWRRNTQEASRSRSVSCALSGDCLLPYVVGRCRAAFPRWWYNATGQACQEFIFGGCGGNANNFMSKKKCFQACVPGESHSRGGSMFCSRLPRPPSPGTAPGPSLPSCQDLGWQLSRSLPPRAACSPEVPPKRPPSLLRGQPPGWQRLLLSPLAHVASGPLAVPGLPLGRLGGLESPSLGVGGGAEHRNGPNPGGEGGGFCLTQAGQGFCA